MMAVHDDACGEVVVERCFQLIHPTLKFLQRVELRAVEFADVCFRLRAAIHDSDRFAAGKQGAQFAWRCLVFATIGVAEW